MGPIFIIQTVNPLQNGHFLLGFMFMPLVIIYFKKFVINGKNVVKNGQTAGCIQIHL